jgi:hypothetical protein
MQSCLSPATIVPLFVLLVLPSFVEADDAKTRSDNKRLRVMSF